MVLLVSIGSYVSFGDVIGEVRARTEADAEAVRQCAQAAIVLERVRDIDNDPVYGIDQLATIGWSSISTAKQNPAHGALVISSLRDLLARWAVQEEEAADETVPVVYPDNLLPQLMDAFESLAIVTSEAMQHQNFTAIVQTFAITFDRLPAALQRRAEEIILRAISCLGDHVLTAGMDTALSALADTLRGGQRHETATAIERARRRLAASVGELNSRSTRVPPEK